GPLPRGPAPHALPRAVAALNVCLRFSSRANLGLDPMADLFTVLTPREAWSRLEPHLHPIDRVETVPTSESLGRVLAADTSAPVDLPHFARSSMDGYAVRAEDTHGATEGLPAYLKVAGEVSMGQPAGVRLSPGEA